MYVDTFKVWWSPKDKCFGSINNFFGGGYDSYLSSTPQLMNKDVTIENLLLYFGDKFNKDQIKDWELKEITINLED